MYAHPLWVCKYCAATKWIPQAPDKMRVGGFGVRIKRYGVQAAYRHELREEHDVVRLLVDVQDLASQASGQVLLRAVIELISRRRV